MRNWRRFVQFMVYMGFCFPLKAQLPAFDTTRYTLQQADRRFLQKNLLLLAQKYNVKASQALILQSRLWNNPNITVSQGVYNPKTEKYFQTGPLDGEEAVDLQQLFLLAGKRNKQIRMAQTNYQLAEDGLFDLLRTLKFTLQTDFYHIYYLEQSTGVYQEEINSLSKVVQAFNEENGKGYIAETEVVRIKAQLYSLESEYNDLGNQLNDVQSEFRLLIQQPQVYLVPQIDSAELEGFNPEEFPLQTLIDSAFHNRTDLRIARDNLLLSKQYYSYQKALAIPDLTLGASYDKNGSYVHNYNSISASFDLPFFNRNQGNIRYSKNQVDFNGMELKSVEQSLEDEVARALQKAVDADKLYRSLSPGFSAEFDRLAQQVLINYQKRNISLLDFLDFYNSYKENVLQMDQIRFNRVSAFEQINFVTGTEFFR